MKTKSGVLAVLALGVTAGAPAADFSYSSVDAGWARADIDNFNEDGDGLFLRGSVGFGTNWFAAAGYRQVSFDAGGLDVDLDLIDIGFGGHMPLSDKVDGVARISYLDVSADGPFGSSADDEGYGLSAGIRALLAPQFELEASLEYSDFDEGGNSTGARLAARYHFTSAWAVGAEVAFSDDQTDYGLYGRYSF
ncbi:MAG: outer membrane beta-barrel protein [Steroidobacteraceae bacterium]